MGDEQLLAPCAHGRRAQLVQLASIGYRVRVETRKWLGLRLCCAGRSSTSYENDKEERYYADKTAIRLWQRERGVEPMPKDGADRLRDWFESPE